MSTYTQILYQIVFIRQDGYAAFTYSIDGKHNLIEYANNQEEHHQKITYKDELLKLLSNHDVQFDPKYML